MVHTANFSHLSIEQIVDKITTSGKISRADQQQFMTFMLSQNRISSTEQAMVDQLFELLRAGRLRVID